MRIILETNALYACKDLLDFNYCQDKKIKLKEFRELLADLNNEVWTSSVSIYEYLLHHENDCDEIRRFLIFIKKYNINILQNVYFPFPATEADSLLSLPYPQISNKLQRYLEKRINIEARFSTLFLVFLIQLYFYTYLEEGNPIDEDLIRSFGGRIVDNIEKFTGEFSIILSEGYKIKRGKKHLKDQFNIMLFNELKALRSFIEVARGNSLVDLDESTLWVEFEKVISRNQEILIMDKPENAQKINEFISNHAFKSQSAVKPYPFLVANYIVMMREKGLAEVQINEMKWIMSKLGEKKKGLEISKFKKNDILDMIIATALSNEDDVLITFDKDMQEFIASIGHKSLQYIKNVYSLDK